MSDSTDTVLVIWRNDPSVLALERHFGVGNVVTSQEMLVKALSQGISYKGIIVLAELSWEGARVSSLYGIELARKIIRPKIKSRLPILFLSFLSLRRIILDAQGTESAQRKLVGALGHDYLRLPATPEQWLTKLRSIEPLNELQFIDVVNNLCDVKGLIGEVIHSAQGKFRDLRAKQTPVSDPVIKDILSTSLQEIANLLGNAEGVETARRETLERFDREVLKERIDLDTFLIARGEELKALVLEDVVDQPTTSITAAPWKVLILDDEPLGLTPLCEGLKRKGIDPIVTSTVAEAQNKIEADVFNEIVLAISDYRLYEVIDGLQRQQRKQGYDFLFEISQKDRITRLIALSGLSRKFLLETFKRFNTRVDVFSKNYLRTEGAVNLFADTILDIAGEAYDALCSQPTASGWAALRHFYVMHRASEDYVEAERIISQRARRYILRIEEIYQGKDESLLLKPSLEELEDLQSDLKGKREISTSLLRRFRNKLVARRIALWLHFAKDFEPERIYAALVGKLDVVGLLEQIKQDLRSEKHDANPNWAAEIEENAQTRLQDRAKPLLNKLALTLSEFPYGLLIEEKRWFKYDMGISNLYDRTEMIDQLFYFVRLGLERWEQVCLESVPKLRQAKVWPKKGSRPITSLGEARGVLDGMREVLDGEHIPQFRSLLKNIRANILANVPETDQTREFAEYLDERAM